ncbi:Asp-tRNA(Asn)/Glu-tRNA(Gln) amidotransferase subunit GatA [Patescibacteria group bacterium]|nr:Asp-tRNA(Asn)/Glu-tRNA(Gln) amidotransferase subunit GatA [Patescibacteria group bacterium]MBU4512354.1 Asp-tRNA(Asn)/Glu-tRNA(Gln) amidotransferase subunit GatA [Patescibacteria group bacterium]MCG2692781.1 Asp-tRNA(Asn)/Glu-tRNA(Gln) amidotransferase subunit GatA [Candidatus Parcubacteria bacterium]
MQLNNLTISKTHEFLVNKEVSAAELLDLYLERIKKVDVRVKAFITVSEKEARKQAQKVDKKISRGEELGILAGIPVGVKDLFCTQGIKTTAGSKILENYLPPYESTTTQRLLAQDAVIIGKTNLDEFAMGSSTENSGFGPTYNPWDLGRVPGGSSGGSAAAVAADECVYALGTDTGGSIRQPASFCGVVGLKPTYGRTSRYGVIAMASSLDTIGHLTKTVEDAAIVLKYIAGHDENDATTPEIPVADCLEDLKKSIAGLKIGVPGEYFITGIDAQVKERVEEAIKKFKELGAEIIDISLPLTEYAVACYYIIQPAEVSSNLARYDGIKYGHSAKDTKDLLDVYLKSRAQGFGAEAKRRIMLGAYTLSAGYYDAYYLQAQKVRTLIKRDFENAFEKVDVILTPTSPTTAFKLGERADDPLQMYLADIYTVSLNLYGGPGISVPCGFIDPVRYSLKKESTTLKDKDKIGNNNEGKKLSNGVDSLPVGLQLIGKHFDEAAILRAAWHYEKATAWGEQRPVL